MEPHQKAILKRMLHKKRVGKHHITIDNLLRGFNDQNKGKLKKAIKQLLKRNILVLYKTKNGDAIYINPADVKAIREKLGLL